MKRRTHVAGHQTRQVPIRRNYCFACGPDNPHGMRLRFYYDEARRRFVGRFRLPRRYQGPPGHAHGGIIATVLDEAMGKLNKLRSVIALTSDMQVEYLKPVPLGKLIFVEARELRVRGRRHVHAAEIKDQRGQVLARGRATFLAVDAQKMFARYLRDGRR